MIRHTPVHHPTPDALSELYDVASALHFLEDALDSHDQAGAQVRSTGAAYLTRLLGCRVSDIATGIWDAEDRSPCAVTPPPHAATPDSSSPAQEKHLAPPSE